MLGVLSKVKILQVSTIYIYSKCIYLEWKRKKNVLSEYSQTDGQTERHKRF